MSRREHVYICPKCGSAGTQAVGQGQRQCLRRGCLHVGRNPTFRTGGPRPAHRLDLRGRDGTEPIAGGGRRRVPSIDDD